MGALIVPFLIFVVIGIVSSVSKEAQRRQQNQNANPMQRPMQPQPPRPVQPARPNPYYNMPAAAPPKAPRAQKKPQPVSMEGMGSAEGQSLPGAPEHCSLPHDSAVPHTAQTQPMVGLADAADPQKLRQAVIWAEILGKPKAYR